MSECWPALLTLVFLALGVHSRAGHSQWKL